MPLDPHLDGKPSTLIRCSAGGETDPRLFYSTSHRTYFHGRNAMDNVPCERELNTQFRWDDDEGSMANRQRRAVQAAGYQRNLLPHFDYDKKVDESEQFQDLDHYDTINKKSFRNPKDVPSRVRGTRIVAGVPDWNREKPLNSSSDVKVNGKWNVFESTMKASYQKNEMFPHLNKHEVALSGRDHESGWVRNCPHEKGGLHNPLLVGEPKPKLRQAEFSVAAQEIPTKVTFVGTTGFSRSDAPIPESDTSRTYVTPAFRMEQLRKENALDYTFLSAYPKNCVPKPLLTSNGLKEVSSAVKEQHTTDVISPMQHRSWDTSYSASYDPMRKPASHVPATNPHINRASNRSGYSMCNKIEFDSFDPTSPLAPNGRIPTSDAMLQAARVRQEMSLRQRV